MKKKLAVIVLLPSILFAALAPLQQSIREMQSVLMYPGLNDLISQSDQIQEITRVSDGYLVITKEKVIKGKVIFHKGKRIGPKKFTIKFYELSEVESKEFCR